MKIKLFNTKLLCGVVISALTFSSCERNKEEDPNPVTPIEEPTPVEYTNGVFVTCEGPFMTGTGTVSYYSRSNGTVYNDLFNSANSLPLGNLVQSMTVSNNKGYVVVNNADKIEVVNSTNFKSLATISGLSLPRYMLAVNANKAYVSQWGSSGVGKGIRVVDLTNNTAGSLIPAGNGPEKMLQNGNLVYVVNSGGLDFDSTVTIINSNSDAVVANIVVGDNPNSIVLDKNGKIWVLCGGVIDYITPANGIPGKLVRIDPTSNTIEASFTFVSHSEHPLNLCTNTTKDKLYFLGNLYSLGSLYSMDITAGALPTTPLINRNFYSLGIDPVTNQIFAGYAPTFSSNGWVLRYSPAAALLDSFQVGIIPSGFCFQ